VGRKLVVAVHYVVPEVRLFFPSEVLVCRAFWAALCLGHVIPGLSRVSDACAAGPSPA
jgi:hypothetical protein